MGCDSAAFARQICVVAEGNFRNILARARVSQLLSWLCLANGDRNLAGLAVVITCDVGDDYWQLLLKRKELAIAVILLDAKADFLLLISPKQTLVLGIVLASGESFTKITLNTPLSKEFQGESR